MNRLTAENALSLTTLYSEWAQRSETADSAFDVVIELGADVR